jgi:uncharacterized phage protein (TIGR01671 family)
MERIIKFRALKDDVLNCNFVYGQLVYDAAGTPRITKVDKSGEGLTFHTCIKGTEGQFTGLHDKNGKEVYESDIVRQYNYLPQQVWFEDGGFLLGIKDKIDRHFYKSLAETTEVIGNIHENKDLTK